MKKILTVLAIIGCVMFYSNVLAGQKQTHCPICNMEIKKDLYADYKGERVYFGCNGCPETFKKNPEKYVNLLKEKGIELEKVAKKQTHCPICNMKINKDLYADYKGERVYFGCGGCPDIFKKNPEKYVRILKDKGVTLEKTPVKK